MIIKPFTTCHRQWFHCPFSDSLPCHKTLLRLSQSVSFLSKLNQSSSLAPTTTRRSINTYPSATFIHNPSIFKKIQTSPFRLIQSSQLQSSPRIYKPQTSIRFLTRQSTSTLSESARKLLDTDPKWEGRGVEFRMDFDVVRYVPIIDALLKEHDLVTVTTRKIRKGLEEELGYAVASQKAEVDALIAERFDIAVAANNNQVKQEPSSPSIPVKKERKSSPPVAVKQERKTSVVDDAKLAAKLQAEWNSAERPSRTGVKRKTPVAKKKKNTVKSKALVSDDSDAEPTEKKKRKVNANNAFMAPLLLSPALSEVLGETQLHRPGVVKAIWAYVKEHGLQDQSDKRYINCDESLKAVFKTDRVHMFTMNKILSTHLYPMEKSDVPAVKKEETPSSSSSSSDEDDSSVKQENQ